MSETASAGARTVFGLTVEPPSGWEDRSVYCFVLGEDGGDAGPMAFVGPMALAGGRGGAAGGGFRPNVVVTRSATAGRSLAQFVADQKRAQAEALKEARVFQDGPTTLGGQPAHESRLELALEKPAVRVAQWIVYAIRDESAYALCCSCLAADMQRTAPKFAELLATIR